MTKKYKFFVVSDVHGEYDAMIEALQLAGFDSRNPDHFFVSLGDSFDRGPKSREIYQFFVNLNKDRKKIVKGNHDVMLQEFVEKGMDGEFVLFNILHNGLAETIKSFSHLNLGDIMSYEALDDYSHYIRDEYMGIEQFFKNMPLWFETDHTIMVHAGLNPNLVDWHLTDEHYALWDIADAHRAVPSTRKTIIFGHYHADQVAEQAKREGVKVFNIKDCPVMGLDRNVYFTGFGNTDEFACQVLPNSNKIAIDGCTNLTHKVNVLVFEDTITTPEEDQAPEQPVDISTIKISKDDMRGYVTTIEDVRADGVITTTTEWNPTTYTINMANYPEPQWFTMGMAEEVDIDGERI